MSNVSHTVTSTWTATPPAVAKAVEIQGNSEVNFNAVVPDATTNQAQAFAMTTAAMQSIYLVSNVDVTAKTNSTGSPGNTIVLKAGVPLVWQVGGYFANPFTTNVTILYLTNASGQQAQVKGRFLSS